MDNRVEKANELTAMRAFRDVVLEAPFDVVIEKAGTCSAYVDCCNPDCRKSIDVEGYEGISKLY